MEVLRIDLSFTVERIVVCFPVAQLLRFRLWSNLKHHLRICMVPEPIAEAYARICALFHLRDGGKN